MPLYGNFRSTHWSLAIQNRLERRRQEIKARRTYIYSRRIQPSPYLRDLALELPRLEEPRRNEIVALKNDISRKEENQRVDDTTLNKLKEEVLLVEAVDLHIEENTREHHADLYDCTERDDDPQLVVRRGQEFKLTLTFQRPWSGKDDDMFLDFKIGETPNPNKGTYATMKLEEGDDTSYMTGNRKKWGARIVEQDKNKLTIAVFPPPNTVIGEWEYVVRTVKEKGSEEKAEVYECEGDSDVIILMNPWCKDDLVYMEKTAELEEYINNEHGIVFKGSASDINTKPWVYGQFQEGILDASLRLLRKANDYAISANMNDPVFIARALSKILNDFDDNGVLAGKWNGPYSDGTHPLIWKGSVPILQQYMEKLQPVKYGQCWVFSHLFTTVARALGLPCRSVTNFESAHDKDLSMTIDKYVDHEGNETGKTSDEVWNFHVWNEVWILRPDLDKQLGVKGKYDGWHAVDATPQELSDSVFQCGPAPLTAIKNGEVNVGYDTNFIFAEVNADRCTWSDAYPPVLLSKDRNSVGMRISTKFPNGGTVGRYRGVDDGVRMDVTHLYKHEEGSVAEREAVERAVRQGRFGETLFENKTGVNISVLGAEGVPCVGEDVTVKVKVENGASEMRMVTLRTNVRPTNYWGGLIGEEKIAYKLYSQDMIEPGKSKTYDLIVEADNYLRLCDEQLSMRVLSMVEIRGFDDPLVGTRDLVIKLPEIECKGPSDEVGAGKEFEVELSVPNPLKNRSLTGCVLRIEGGVIVAEGEVFKKEHAVYTKEISDIKPGGTTKLKVKVKANERPKRSSDREMEVGLESKEIPGLEGSLAIVLRR